MMLIGALPNQGHDVASLEAWVEEEIRRLQEEGITERELQKAKNQLRWEAVQARSTVQSSSASPAGMASPNASACPWWWSTTPGRSPVMTPCSLFQVRRDSQAPRRP